MKINALETGGKNSVEIGLITVVHKKEEKVTPRII